MSIALVESIKIKCKNCGNEITISQSEFKHEISRDDSKELGVEKVHKFSWSKNCPNCENPISIEIIGREYPECAYKGHTQEISGADFIAEPKLHIVHER